MSGMEGDVVTMQEIFKFEQTGIDQNGKVKGAVSRDRYQTKVRREVSSHGHSSPQ